MELATILMKIYTKTGDAGKTSLIGGTRVSKYHPRIEAYGTIDELNSHIGLIADQEIAESFKPLLLIIQDRLFTIGSLLAADPEKSKMKLPDLNESDVFLIEKEIDRMDESLPELRAFILPGGHTVVSICHIARCVCRRAERQVIHLSEENSIEPLIIVYLNRLSDFLFILARMLAKNLGVKEVLWRVNP
jgi:cob(I)alamin adenosyltransferase